jgi:hypothetical protein
LIILKIQQIAKIRLKPDLVQPIATFLLAGDWDLPTLVEDFISAGGWSMLASSSDAIRSVTNFALCIDALSTENEKFDLARFARAYRMLFVRSASPDS